MKAGRVKDPLYKDSYLGITQTTFTPPLEPFESPWFPLPSAAHRGELGPGGADLPKRDVRDPLL